MCGAHSLNSLSALTSIGTHTRSRIAARSSARSAERPGGLNCLSALMAMCTPLRRRELPLCTRVSIAFRLKDVNINPRPYLLAQISKNQDLQRFAINPTANYTIFAAAHTRTHRHHLTFPLVRLFAKCCNLTNDPRNHPPFLLNRTFAAELGGQLSFVLQVQHEGLGEVLLGH